MCSDTHFSWKLLHSFTIIKSVYKVRKGQNAWTKGSMPWPWTLMFLLQRKPEVVLSSCNLLNKGLGFPNSEHRNHLNVTAKYKCDRILDDINIREWSLFLLDAVKENFSVNITMNMCEHFVTVTCCYHVRKKVLAGPLKDLFLFYRKRDW